MTHALMAKRMDSTPEMHRAHKKTLGPTIERQSKGDLITEEETAQAGQKRKRVETQRLLDRYRRRGQISKRQYDAGYRLYGAFEAAGGLTRITSSYTIRLDNASPDGLVRQVEAFERCSKALNYVGPELSPVLVAVCLMDQSARDWALGQERAPESGIEILRLGLDRLAVFYSRKA